MKHIDLILISNSLVAFGLVLLIVSIAMYIKRTGDKSALTRFWISKTELTKSEVIINRVGFGMFVVGIILPIVILLSA